MAKVQDDSKEIKKMLQQLFVAVKSMSEAGHELHSVNRDLLKVMSLLNSGFEDNAKDATNLIKSIKEDGLTITDEFAKKWAKARKLTDEDLKKIIDKFHEIEKVGDDVIDNASDYTDLLEEQLNSIEKNVDLSTKLLNGHKQIAEALSASKKQAEALGGSVEQVNNLTQKLLQKKVDVNSMFNNMFNGMEKGQVLVSNIKSDIDSLIQRASDSNVEVDFKFNVLTNDVDKEVKKVLDSIDEEKASRLKGLKDYYSKNTELQNKMAMQIAAQNYTKDIKFDINTGDISTAAGILKQGTTDYENVLSDLSKIVSDNKLISVADSSLNDMVDLLQKGVHLSDHQNNQIIKYNDLLDDTNKLIFQQFDLKYRDLSILQESIKTERSRLSIVGKYTDQLSAARTVVEKIANGFDYINDILPSGVSDFLGISKVSLSLLEAHRKGMERFTEYVENGGDLAKSMSVYMEELGPSIRTALNPMTLLVAAGALLFQTLRNTVQTYKDISSELGVSIKQSKELFEVQLDILTSQKNQFATMDDIRQIQTEMIQSGKSLNSLNTKGAKELAINLSDTGKAFGYGSEQAAKLQNVFTDLGADDSLALNLQTNLGLMTEMAGLSPQIISNDLIEGSEVVYTYFAGMPEMAAKTALQVRRMGMSLQQAGSIAKKMLNLESFMTDMYELQAMSGGGVDFSSAFDKGLVGDIEGMTKDIMKEIGTTAEYNKMDFLTRKKIADTLGMDVAELGKSVKLNEQISWFTGETKDALEANVDRMGDISKLSKDEIRNRLQQLQSTDRLNVAWDKIKGVLIKALIPLAESFADAIDAISPIIDLVVGGLKGIGLVVKLIVPLVKGMLAPFKFIGDILSKVTGYLDDSAGSASIFGKVIKGIGSTFDIIGKGVYYVGAALGTWALIFKLPAVLGSVLNIFKSIFSFIPGIGTIFKSLFGGFGDMFGIFGKKSKEAAKESTDPIIGMTSKIESSMIGMVDRIKSSMDSMVSYIKESMSSASSSIKKEFNTSPTEKLMGSIKKDGVDVTKVISQSTQDSAKEMAANVEDGVKKSKKSLKGLKDEASGIIPITPIKKSFGLVTEIGTKSLAILAAKTATSFLFAKKEGEQHLSGISAEIQSVIEMAAMGGAAIVTDALSEGFESVISKKLQKRMDKGFDGMGKSLSGKMTKAGEVSKNVLGKITGGLNKDIDNTGEKAQGVFSKISSYGKSAFEKLKDLGKSLMPKPENIEEGAVESIKKIVEERETITESVNKEPKKELTKRTETKLEPIKAELPSKTEKSIEKTGSIFERLSNVIKTAWQTVKNVLLDIVKFVGDVLKSITDAVGKSIENLLKGISRGLNSFRTSAVKGAASLVLVSGALWITSKALENFANVSWESVGKGILTLGALSVAGIMLGKMSGQLIQGALAIGILGVSLIPAAYALKMFNDVEWKSIGKGLLSLLVLGPVGALFSALAPELLIGAIGIAALGASMIPLAYSLKMLNEVEWTSIGKGIVGLLAFGVVGTVIGLTSPLIAAGAIAITALSAGLFMLNGTLALTQSILSNLDTKNIKALTDELKNLTSVSVSSLFNVAGGIGAIAGAMMALSLVGAGNSVVKFFGGDALSDLEKLTEMSAPLNDVNKTISSLSASIVELSEVISTANFDAINKLNDIDVKSIDQNITQKINTVAGKVQNYSDPSIDYKISPIQTQVADVKTPKRESVAQNVSINKLPGKNQSGEDNSEETNNNTVKNSYYSNNYNEESIYDRPGMDTKKIEMLLMRMIQLLEINNQKSTNISMNHQKIGEILKAGNNSK